MPHRRRRGWLPGLRPAHDGHEPRGDTPAPERSMDPRAAAGAGDRGLAPPPVAESLIDAAIYVNGRRHEAPSELDRIHAQVPDEPRAFAWIGLLRPTDGQMLAVAEEFGLHELAVEDTIVAHQRPKLERYGQTLFVALKPARYRDDTEQVEFGEIHVFLGEHFVLTVRHSDAPDLSVVRRRLEGDPDLLALGPEAALYAILDAIVDGYAPVIAGLQNDVDEIETQVFGGDPGVSRRIYALSREVIEFQRATRPLLDILDGLTGGFEKYGTGDELRRYLRDVADHATTVAERADGFRQMLQGMLTVNSTLVSQAQNEEMRRLSEAGYQQNEQMKKISSWAAILFAPTLVGTVYGMNFTNMPELHWFLGYPFALALMAAVCVTLFVLFKRSNWL